jgi:hypothetical protein
MTDAIPPAPDGWHTADATALERARTDDGLRIRIVRALWRRDYLPGPEAQIGGYIYQIADRVAVAIEPRTADETLTLIRRATFDPGAFVTRGDDYAEPLWQWQARAVQAALAAGSADA